MMEKEGSYHFGSIEVICGSMFSGKTEELIRRITRAQIARQPVQVFKPAIDARYGIEHIASHNSRKIKSELVFSSTQISEKVLPETRVVAIDEGQFFDHHIVSVCQELANSGRRVIVAGLDQDYKGEPFDPMPQLMAIAEFVTKCNAICVLCGRTASRTQRLVVDAERVKVGAAGMYEARCRFCHTLPTHEQITMDTVKPCS